jgi:hypothetical protein
MMRLGNDANLLTRVCQRFAKVCTRPARGLEDPVGDRSMTPRSQTLAALALLLGCMPPAQEVVRDDAGSGTSTGGLEGTMGSTSSGSSDDALDDDTSTGSEETTSGGMDRELDCRELAGHVIYVNFDGLTPTHGEKNDARVDETELEDLAIELAPYSASDEEKQAIVSRVGQLFEDFDACVTDTRPVDGDYTMAIVTPTNPVGAGAIAVGDCGNENPNDIVFVFPEPRSSAEPIATGMTFVLGVAYGLEPHQDDEHMDDLMYMWMHAGEPRFKDACITVMDTDVSCDHAACDGPRVQNSWRELRDTLGAGRG